MQYHDVPPITRSQAEALFVTNQTIDIINALLRLAFHYPDWRWVQTCCLTYIQHPDSGVKAMAVLCLGHLARIHKHLDLELVLPQLEALRLDPVLSGRVEDVMDDIRLFVTTDKQIGLH